MELLLTSGTHQALLSQTKAQLDQDVTPREEIDRVVVAIIAHRLNKHLKKKNPSGLADVDVTCECPMFSSE